MFLNKNKKETNILPQNIAILGTTALGLFLAERLQAAGHNVFLLCPPKTADEYNATDFIFKEPNMLKNLRSNFHFGHELPFKPRFLFICSSPQYLKANLTLLSPSQLANTFIINFCEFDDSLNLSDIFNKPTIKAFFEGWLNKHKNQITILHPHTKICFSLNNTTEEAVNLRQILETSPIKFDYYEDYNHNLWMTISPLIAYELLTNSYQKNISDIAKSDNGRQTINNLLSEISNLAAKDNISISSAFLLPKLYEIPTSWTSPLQKSISEHNLLLFDKITSFLMNKSGKNIKKYPTLFQLINKLFNRY